MSLAAQRPVTDPGCERRANVYSTENLAQVGRGTVCQ